MPSGNPSVDWNEENTNKLKTMWADGYNGSQIAAEIPHATRNAVMGKLNRLGLSGRKPKKAPKPRAPRVRTATGAPRSKKQKIEPLAPVIPPAPDMKRVSYADNDGCMWELEQKGIYCGAPKAKGYSFCPYHNHIARPAREKPATPAGK